MLIGFDASRAFVSEATGTENYSLNLLKALARIDRKNRYRVYLREVHSAQWRVHSQSSKKDLALITKHLSLPNNFEFKIIRPSRLWTQLGLALETWKNPVDLLFVPAHTLPILRRRKIGISNFKFQISNFSKTVVTIHDLGVEYLPNYHKFPQRTYLDFASRYAAKHADGIIAVSAATKADLVKRYKANRKKISVVHEGVDRSFFKRSAQWKVESVKSKYKIKSPYILFVGTIQPRKNLLMLIQAFAKIDYRLQTTDYRQKKAVVGRPWTVDLIIAGKLGWDYAEIVALPKKLGIGDRVKFLGHVANSDLPSLYSGAAVFAFPSLFEGFGLPILEAISCGCPVVASDIPPHREILQKLLLLTTNYQLQTKFVPMTLVKPRDIDGWAQVLYQTITQYEKRFDLSNKKLNLEAKFGWDEAAKKTLEVFEAVLG